MPNVEPSNPAPGLADEPADWETTLLNQLGVTKPTKADYTFLKDWFAEEHGAGLTTGAAASGYVFDPVSGTLTPKLAQHGGLFNPLDTTLETGPGDTALNTDDVQNYPSAAAGIAATVQTLKGSDPSYGYGAIVSGLGSGASLTQLEQAEASSSWGDAFPGVGGSPAPGSSGADSEVTAAAGGAVGGVAETFAAGLLGALRDLLEMAGGVALVALGVYMIVKDLQGAGVPLGPATKAVNRLVSPSQRARRAAGRAETGSRTEIARTRAAEAQAAREHVGRRTEATTRTAEEKAAQSRAASRVARAQARSEEHADRLLRASGTTAGGSSRPARDAEAARRRAAGVEYGRTKISRPSGMRPGHGTPGSPRREVRSEVAADEQPF